MNWSALADDFELFRSDLYGSPWECILDVQ